MQLREEPGKQKTRSCRAQELSRSRAQGKAAAEKEHGSKHLTLVATAEKLGSEN